MTKNDYRAKDLNPVALHILGMIYSSQLLKIANC